LDPNPRFLSLKFTPPPIVSIGSFCKEQFNDNEDDIVEHRYEKHIFLGPFTLSLVVGKLKINHEEHDTHQV